MKYNPEKIVIQTETLILHFLDLQYKHGLSAPISLKGQTMSLGNKVS